MGKINTAIFSVTDKSGVEEFARSLADFGVEILSTGGTAKKLKESGVSVTEVSEYTGFPEMMDGRIKTLHPRIHGGLLGVRDNPDHVAKMKEYGIKQIDLVVINLYAFEKTVANPDCSLENAIENIDIGGPAMLRAAAKNYKYVTVVVDPSDYEAIITEMKNNDGKISEETNFRLARKVFELTHNYDGAITNYLASR